MKPIQESEIIQINPIQQNAPNKLKENPRRENIESAARFEEIASKDPLNQDVDVDIGPTGTRR